MPSFAAMRMLFPKSLPRLKQMNCAIFQEPVSVLRRNGRSCSPLAALQFIPEATTCLRCRPPKASSGETVFHFARDAKDLFQKSFKTYIDAIKAANAEKKPGEEPPPVPSLSLGISICYSKFPLYEALDDSADLLFRLRKRTDAAKLRCRAASETFRQSGVPRSEGH